MRLLLLDLGFAPAKARTEALKILEQADTNKNGTIEFDEFKAIWHRKLLSQHEQYIHRVFAGLCFFACFFIHTHTLCVLSVYLIFIFVNVWFGFGLYY